MDANHMFQDVLHPQLFGETSQTKNFGASFSIHSLFNNEEQGKADGEKG